MGFDASCDMIVAVGSGVINDIGKILANTSKKPYLIFGTAPSMQFNISKKRALIKRFGDEPSSKCPLDIKLYRNSIK